MKTKLEILRFLNFLSIDFEKIYLNSTIELETEFYNRFLTKPNKLL